MKIAYMITTPLPTQKANIIQSLEMVFAFLQAGVEVDFFCPKANAEMPDCEIRESLESFFNRKIPFNITCVPYKSFMGRFGSLLTIPALKQVVSLAGHYDYYFVRNEPLFFAMTRLGKPVIFEQHQWDYYRDRLRSALVRFSSVKASRRNSCRLYICISETLRHRWIKRGVPPEKTLTAHDAVNLDQFTPFMSKQKARKAIGIPQKGVVVSYVGSLYGNRAIEDVIMAAEKIPSATFRFIGGPEKERQRLTNRASELGLSNAHFIGRVSRNQIPLHLFASDVLLFTMNRQTLTFDICSPMKIFEYLAAGRLIVAPDLPSMREVLSAPHAFLYTFPEQESFIEKVSRAVNAAMNGLVEEYSEDTRNLVQKQFTWQDRVKKILKRLR